MCSLKASLFLAQASLPMFGSEACVRVGIRVMVWQLAILLLIVLNHILELHHFIKVMLIIM